MKLDRFTKAQLIKKLKTEERLTAKLEVTLEKANADLRQDHFDLNKAHERIKELEQISAEALQTAKQASRAVETFRYTGEKEIDLAASFAKTSKGLIGALNATMESNLIRENMVQNLRKLFHPVTICPRCGHIQRSKEHNVLLCDACMAARTKSSPS